MQINIIEPLQIRHHEVMKKTEQLHETVNNLVYEGKVSLGKNLIKIEKIIEFYKDKLLPHMNFDENCVFPYVNKHIPKYEPTLQFLSAEHEEICENFSIFESYYKQLKAQTSDKGREEIIDKLRDRGIYLFCVIRNHLQTEEKSVHKAILEQLHDDEKNELFSKILECECAKNYIHRHNEVKQ